MGLFSSSPATTSTSSPSTPSPSNDGAYIAPDRNQRQHCWDARDLFFACLDRNNIVDSIREKGKANELCGNEDRRLEGECARSWVTYFKQRRVSEFKKAETLDKLKREGAKPLAEGFGSPGLPPGGRS